MRHADFYTHTLTYARVLPHNLYQALSNRGKSPDGGFGPQGYHGRYVRGLGREGQPLWEFVNS